MVKCDMDNSLYDDWIRPLGDEYPAAIKIAGTRVPLEYETRFQRHYVYREPEKETHDAISRFVDESASVTFSELKQEWSTWTDADRADFCASISDLELIGQRDLADIVRFLLQNPDPGILAPVVLYLPVRQMFPAEETFQLVAGVLERTTPGRSASVVKALGLTKHPRAEAMIRRHLARIVMDPATRVHADFFNNLAQDAAYCILSLLKLGAPPADFEDIARRLSGHCCRNNREWFRRNLAEHYAWLRQPADEDQA